MVSRVLVAPGNAGTGAEPGIENVDVGVEAISSLVELAKKERIDLTIVGPEVPLVMGIVDEFERNDLKCFGPTGAAARLEGSKTFTKEFLKRHHIPAAESESFADIDQAVQYLDRGQFPIVIKADGLAAGKGVIIADSRSEAINTIKDMLADNKFGEAGSRVVIEEFLSGEEASFICMVDGKNILPMASSQDHKAAYDGDIGPNTGGMGAYSPAPVVDRDMYEKIIETVISPTVGGMLNEGNPYVGFLYAGLMIGEDGVPRVLEFNCRLGDPETQPMMMRLRSDLLEHCLAAVEKRLEGQKALWDNRPALGVVLAAEGYPGDYEKDKSISGLDKIGEMPSDVKLFHAGTLLREGEVMTCGGRVMCATALGENISVARSKAYALAKSVNWSGCRYRSDIGYRALNRSL